MSVFSTFPPCSSFIGGTNNNFFKTSCKTPCILSLSSSFKNRIASFILSSSTILPANVSASLSEFVKSAYTNHQGSLINTSIVLSGTARDSIHRPQRCLKGQGHNLDSEYTIEIPISGRKPLSVRIIKTSRIFQTSEGEIPYYGYYAYWFVGQFRETPYHLERMFWLAWDRVVNSTANRWAYIAVSGKREIDDNSFEDDIISFVQQVYPNILTKDLHSKIYALK